MSSMLWFGAGMFAVFILLALLFALHRQALSDARQTQADIYRAIAGRFLKPDGMVESEPGKATSEGQSYFMIMAVVADDRASFERVWSWTKMHLRAARGDHLFSWLWENGQIRDPSSATDADEDIAFALEAASAKWGDPGYRLEAREIIGDIWEKETREIGHTRYLGAGDWVGRDPDGIILNPSYFAPYAYRLFAKEDPAHPWQEIIDSSYAALERCVLAPGLAKNWCRIDSSGMFGAAVFPDGRNAGENSFDALRVPFRLALDYRRSGDRRAFRFLAENRAFSEDWAQSGKVYAAYGADGGHAEYETLARYGGTLPLFVLTDRPTASRVYFRKIQPLPANIGTTFYDFSWAWFGLSFFTDTFPRPPER